MKILKGNFQNQPAPAVFVHLIATRATGRWSCRAGHVQKDIWMVNGAPVFASSNQVSESLFRLCLQWQIINDDEHQAFIEEAESRNIRSGELLKEKKGLSDDGLKQLLAKQALARCTELMRWQKGTYSFMDGEEVPQVLSISRLRILADSIPIRFNRETFTQLVRNLEKQEFSLQLQQLDLLHSVIGSNPLLVKMIGFFGAGPRLASEAIAALAQDLPKQRAWQLFLVAMDLGILFSKEAPIAQFGAEGSNSAQRPKRDSAPMAAQQQKTEEGVVDAELEKLYKEWTEKNAFEILAVEQSASDGDVRKAYFKLAKKYHPDRFYDRENRRTNQSAEKVFALIGQTFEQIKTGESRSQYINYLETGLNDNSAVDMAKKIMESELMFQKAQVLIRKRSYDEAIAMLDDAIELNPEEAEYFANQGWVMFIRDWGKKDMDGCNAGKKKINEAIKLNPNSAESYYLLGRIHSIMGETAQAIKQFQICLDKSPAHREAKSDMQRLQAKGT